MNFCNPGLGHRLALQFALLAMLWFSTSTCLPNKRSAEDQGLSSSAKSDVDSVLGSLRPSSGENANIISSSSASDEETSSSESIEYDQAVSDFEPSDESSIEDPSLGLGDPDVGQDSDLSYAQNVQSDDEVQKISDSGSDVGESETVTVLPRTKSSKGSVLSKLIEAASDQKEEKKPDVDAPKFPQSHKRNEPFRAFNSECNQGWPGYNDNYFSKPLTGKDYGITNAWVSEGTVLVYEVCPYCIFSASSIRVISQSSQGQTDILLECSGRSYASGMSEEELTVNRCHAYNNVCQGCSPIVFNYRSAGQSSVWIGITANDFFSDMDAVVFYVDDLAVRTVKIALLSDYSTQ